MKVAVILFVVLFCVVWLMRRPFGDNKGCSGDLMCKVGDILEWAMVAQLMIIINKLFSFF